MKVPDATTLSGPAHALSENTNALDKALAELIFVAEDARNALILMPSHELSGFAQRFALDNTRLQGLLAARYSLLGITGTAQS